MQATHWDAEQRYQAMRVEALRVAQSALNEMPEYRNLELKLFTPAAMQDFEIWKNHPQRRVRFQWQGYKGFQYVYPKRFEMVSWENGKVVNFALGQPTFGGNALRLDIIESSPLKPKELNGFFITQVAMITYATALGVSQLRVMHPINEVVRGVYESYGFTYVAKGDYLFKDL